VRLQTFLLPASTASPFGTSSTGDLRLQGPNSRNADNAANYSTIGPGGALIPSSGYAYMVVVNNFSLGASSSTFRLEHSIDGTGYVRHPVTPADLGISAIPYFFWLDPAITHNFVQINHLTVVGGNVVVGAILFWGGE